MCLMVKLLLTILVYHQALGESNEIAPGVYSFISDGSCVSLFVLTGQGVLVIEPCNSFHSSKMLQAIQELSAEPISHLFISHNHWDHASGSQVFKNVGATIVAHDYAYQYLMATPGPDTLVPDETWSGNYTKYSQGNTNLELFYFGASHGVGMTAFLLPDTKIAYMADTVSPNSVGFATLPDFDINGWELTLTKYLELDFETAIFSHNAYPEPLKGGGKEDVLLMIEYIQDIRVGIYDEIEKGTFPFLIPSILKLPKYEHLANYDEFLAMNIWAILLQEPFAIGPFLSGPRYQD